MKRFVWDQMKLDETSLSIRSALSLFRFHLYPFPQKRLILRLRWNWFVFLTVEVFDYVRLSSIIGQCETQTADCRLVRLCSIVELYDYRTFDCVRLAKFFVSSIKFDYRIQSNPIERLGSIGFDYRTFDWLRRDRTKYTSFYERINSGYAIKPKKSVKRQTDTKTQWNTLQLSLFYSFHLRKSKVYRSLAFADLSNIFLIQSLRGTQREYSSKALKHSIVKRILVFKR